jgi:murein DD-endopeptidase MepM/ murein hydrolase activator NlpD
MDPTFLARLALLSAVLAISSPPATPPTIAQGYTLYVVQTGDTLFSIAQKFETTVDALQQANNITDPNTLTPGQKIQVPVKSAPTPTTVSTPTPITASAQSPNATSYTVKAGDTLASIAARYNVSVAALAQANGIQDVNVVSVGQVLVIPTSASAGGSPNSLPVGVTIIPPVVKQGNTVEFKITASDVTTATGTFNSSDLQFISDNGTLYALAGISRCANLGNYPASITTTSGDGQTHKLSFSVRVNATNYPVQDITLTPQMASLLDPTIERDENIRIANVVAAFSPTKFWGGPFQPPLAVKAPPITALFGTRRSYNGGAVGLCGHEGQDWGVPGGTPVHAPAGGTIVIANPLKVRGNVVFINHGLGVFTGFFHLSEIDVKVGQTVKTGDIVGKVGTTGFSTGNHLHWSLWVDNVYVDPIEWENRTIP